MDKFVHFDESLQQHCYGRGFLSIFISICFCSSRYMRKMFANYCAVGSLLYALVRILNIFNNIISFLEFYLYRRTQSLLQQRYSRMLFLYYARNNRRDRRTHSTSDKKYSESRNSYDGYM